jgi:hypothetical protein
LRRHVLGHQGSIVPNRRCGGVSHSLRTSSSLICSSEPCHTVASIGGSRTPRDELLSLTPP